jgi:predicted permease
MLEVDPVGRGYPQPQILLFCSNLLTRLQAMPGVDAVSVSENGVFSGTDSLTGSLRAEGFTPSKDADMEAHSDQVGPHYFRAVGIALLEGRDFDEHDAGEAPRVAIVNETMANFYFAHNNPIGRHFTIGRKKPVVYSIVGVARNAQDHGLTNAPERRYYTPLLEATNPIADFNFEIRTRQEASLMVSAVRKTTQEFDANLKISELKPVTELMDRTIGEERLIAQLSVGLGILALLLAATGLYGVMAYSTSRRAGEIGLRMALGADRNRVVWMVLREALWLSVLGICVGVPAALAAAKLVQHSVVGLSTTDPLVFSVAAAVMMVTAGLAGLLPAARASRIDPMTALRQE